MSSPLHPWPYVLIHSRSFAITRPEMIPERMSIVRSAILSRNAVSFRLRRFLFTLTLMFITVLSVC